MCVCVCVCSALFDMSSLHGFAWEQDPGLSKHDPNMMYHGAVFCVGCFWELLQNPEGHLHSIQLGLGGEQQTVCKFLGLMCFLQHISTMNWKPWGTGAHIRYIEMELLKTDRRKIIGHDDDDDGLPSEVTTTMLEQVMSGLRDLHLKELVHRDIKWIWCSCVQTFKICCFDFVLLCLLGQGGDSAVDHFMEYYRLPHQGFGDYVVSALAGEGQQPEEIVKLFITRACTNVPWREPLGQPLFCFWWSNCHLKPPSLNLFKAQVASEMMMKRLGWWQFQLAEWNSVKVSD